MTLDTWALLGDQLTQLKCVERAEVTCGVCPLQVEGVLSDGREFYFRARHGRAELRIAPPGGDVLGDAALVVSAPCHDGLSTAMVPAVITTVKHLFSLHSIPA